MSTTDAHLKQLAARRTCSTCACYAVTGPGGEELPRDSVLGPTAQPCCRLNPLQPIQQRMERAILNPDGTPSMVKEKDGEGRPTGRMVPRTESVLGWVAIHPPTYPTAKCWQWRPSHVLPGDHSWLPHRAPHGADIATEREYLGPIPAPAGDPPAG